MGRDGDFECCAAFVLEDNNAREYPGVYKVHVDYSATTSAVVITPYHPKRVESLQLVAADIDYSYKYADRTALTGCLP